MLTLKTLSPEKGIVGEGRWVPAPSRQHSLVRQMGKCQGAPRDLWSRRALHEDYVVTREVRQSAYRKCAPSDKCRKQGRGWWLSEVGGTCSSYELW